MKYPGYFNIEVIEATEGYIDTQKEILDIIEKSDVIDCQTYNSNSNNYDSVPMTTRKPFFVVGEKEDSVVARFKSEKECAVGESSRLRSRVIELENQVHSQKEEVEKTLRRLKNSRETCDACENQLSEARDQSLKYEQDIAKIRNAIGEIKMNEILNA